MQQTFLLTVPDLPACRGHRWLCCCCAVTITYGFDASRSSLEFPNSLISLQLLRGFDSGATGYQFEEFFNWIAQPPIHYHLGVDGLSLFLVLLTTLLTPISIWRLEID